VRTRVSIATKFFLTYFVITGVALAFAGMAGYLQFRKYAMDEVDGNLLRQARLVSSLFRPLLDVHPPDVGKIALEGDKIGRDLDIRLTVILPDGRVAADSSVGAGKIAGMENHYGRPEVHEALSGRTGTSLRRSITMREEERYLAVPVYSGERVVGAVRTSIPVELLAQKLARVRVITWGTGFVAFLLMLAGTAIRAKHVTGPLKEMTAAARELASGIFSKRVRVESRDELGEMA
jgi:two-component system phosphate regulon sensor histidine kinase PhoR